MIDIEQADNQARQFALALFAVSHVLSDNVDQPPPQVNSYQKDFCAFLTEDLSFSMEDRLESLMQAVEATPTPNHTMYTDEDEEKIESFSCTLAGLADASDHKHDPTKNRLNEDGSTDQTPQVDFDDYKQAFEICLRRPSLLAVRQKFDVLETMIKTHHGALPFAERSAKKFVDAFDISNKHTLPPPSSATIVQSARDILTSSPRPVSIQGLRPTRTQPESSSPSLFPSVR